MTFYTNLNQLIAQCNSFHDKVEEQELCFTEPYQSKFLNINKLLKVYNEQKLAIEAAAAGEQTAPGMANLTPARQEFYELEEDIPPFLAGEHKWYFWLQTYKIRIVHLLKTFSYSSFKGDWAKMRVLKTWYAAIQDEQEAHNASASINKSFEDIEDLGDFEKLTPQKLQLLQEEVHNIQTLLKEDPSLEEKITPEQATLLKNATQYLKENADKLKDLPEIDNSFVYEEPPVLDTVMNLCSHLTILIDAFSKEHGKTRVTEMFGFLRALEDAFDPQIPICMDIYNAIKKAIGSHKTPTAKGLVRMLHKAMDPFTNEKYLAKHYSSITAISLDVERGIPDTIDFEMCLLLAIGDV